MKLWQSLSRQEMILSRVFVIVATLLSLSSCRHVVPVLKPPPCPMWSEAAILNLETLLHMQELGEIDIISLEYQLGENQRHCEALDAFLEE